MLYSLKLVLSLRECAVNHCCCKTVFAACKKTMVLLRRKAALFLSLKRSARTKYETV